MGAEDFCPLCNRVRHGGLCTTGGRSAPHVPPTGYFQGIPPEQPSRRERIATAALQGLLAGQVTRNGGHYRGYGDSSGSHFSIHLFGEPGEFTKLAVRIADALIAELDKSACDAKLRELGYLLEES